MPYIDHEARVNILDMGYHPRTAGELNFVISQLVSGYIQREGLGYATINEVIGVLECNKMETYRRIAAPYEDHKREVNGDVFPDKLLTKQVKHKDDISNWDQRAM